MSIDILIYQGYLELIKELCNKGRLFYDFRPTLVTMMKLDACLNQSNTT